MRALTFIINPAAGNGRGQKTWVTIERMLQHKDITYINYITSKSGDARRFASEVAKNHNDRAIIVVGGDGTLSEAAHGLYDVILETTTREQSNGAIPLIPPLGYIPSGSANDFARAHGIPMKPLAAMQLILDILSRGSMSNVDKPSLPLIDILESDHKTAINSIGCGFDGKVAQLTNKASYKKWLNLMKMGKAAYMIALVHSLFSYQPYHVRIDLDGKQLQFDKVWLVASTNHPYFGGGMKFCPQAVPDDGWADIFVVHNISKFEFLRVFPQVYSGRHVNHPAVTFLRGRDITIDSDHPLVVQADGEFADHTPVRICIGRAQLPIIKA